MKVSNLISKRYGSNTYDNRKINMHGKNQGDKMFATIEDLTKKVLDRVIRELIDENTIFPDIVETIHNDYSWRNVQEIGLKVCRLGEGLILEKLAKKTSPSGTSIICEMVNSGEIAGKKVLTKNDIINQLKHPDLTSELKKWRNVEIPDDSRYS